MPGERNIQGRLRPVRSVARLGQGGALTPPADWPRGKGRASVNEPPSLMAI
jgi:hypothetical protein